MTEETGQGIHAEMEDLRKEFRDFRKWIISGLVAFILQGGYILWNAGKVEQRVTNVEKSVTKHEEILSDVHEEQLRRSSLYSSVSEMQSDLKLVRSLLQDVRDDVVLLKAKNGDTK